MDKEASEKQRMFISEEKIILKIFTKKRGYYE
jgi:hypothetical protein